MHITIKKMQFLTGESHPLYIHCYGIENPQYLLENLRLITLDRGERPTALLEESPYDLINVLGRFSQPRPQGLLSYGDRDGFALCHL